MRSMFVDCSGESGLELATALLNTGRWKCVSQYGNDDIYTFEGEPQEKELKWISSTVDKFFTEEHPSAKGKCGFGFVTLSNGKQAFIHLSDLTDRGRQGVPFGTELDVYVRKDRVGSGLKVSKVRPPQGLICQGIVTNTSSKWCYVQTDRFSERVWVSVAKFNKGGIPQHGSTIIVEVYDRGGGVQDGLVGVHAWINVRMI